MSALDEATRQRLVGLFVAEAEEGLAQLLENAGRFRLDGDAAAVQEFKETAHSLKGAAAAVGLPDVVWAIHRIEVLGPTVAAMAQDQRGPEHERLVGVLHLLESVVAALGRGQQVGGPQLAQLKAGLAGVELATPSPALVEAPRAPAPAPAPAAAPGPARDIEAPLERLNVPAREVDEALRLASSVARLAAAVQGEATGAQAAQVSHGVLELTLASARLESVLFNLRMLPASEALEGLPGEMTVLAARLGKEVRFEVEEHQVRADRRTLHTARTLMRHLLRNAMDHGLETPAERERSGKPAEGRLTVRLALVENTLRVEIEDDGAGFDTPRVRERLAARTGAPDRVAALSDEEVLIEFATLGGSTRASATEISGRGVGLSAVVNQVRAGGGQISIRSLPGRGTMIGFTLPLDVFATDVLTVRCGKIHFGLLITSVERIVCLADSKDMIQQGPSGAMLAFDERIVHLRSLEQMVGWQGGGGQRFAAVVRDGERSAAFTADDLGEVVRLVPQAVPPWVQPGRMVTGMARLADGSPVQILNAQRLLEKVLQAAPQEAPRLESEPAAEVPKGGPASKRRLHLLLAEDSLATREVLRVLLEREGCEVRVAGDGHEAQARIAERLPDVVVSDFNMPRCDGPSLTRALRASARTARLPVILLTSRDDDASRQEGAAAGADAYLIKSDFNAQLLRQTLRRLGVEE